LTIKKSERDFAEGTNGGQGRIGKPVRVGEFQQALPNLVALLEHKRECLQSIFIVSGFDLSFDASRIFLPKPLQFLSSCARNRIGWQGSATGCDP